MYIPKSKLSTLEDFSQDLVRRCTSTQQERSMIYDLYKRYFLFGSDDGVADYNKILAHVDKVVSYIYECSAAQFTIDMPDVVTPEQKKMAEMCHRSAREINRMWHQNTFDVTKEGIVTLALVFGSMFEKVLWKPTPDGPGPEMYAIEPSNIGVLREDLNHLSQQEAICHSFYMTADECWRMLRVQDGGRDMFDRIQFSPSIEIQPPMNALQQMIVSASNPNMIGSQAPDLAWPSTMFRPQMIQDAAQCQELWVWDDQEDDYYVITLIEPNVIMFKRPNFHLPRRGRVGGKHPFVKTCGFPLNGYFYGISEIFFLLGLQQWHERRIKQIQRLQDMQVDPPASASGFTGITDEQFAAFMQPGGRVRGELPGAKMETLAPKMPDTIFEEVGGIEGFFRDMSGMSDILEGKGTQNVRDVGHAVLLALYGGSRIKKKAVAVGQGVSDSANQLYQLGRRYDKTHMMTEDGTAFTFAQLPDDVECMVDSNSHSPAFTGDHKQEADKLFKAGAIDKETLLDMSSLPGRNRLVMKLKDREKAQAQQREKLLQANPELAKKDATQQQKQMLKTG